MHPTGTINQSLKPPTFVPQALATWAISQYGLRNKYHTNHMVRLLDIYCRLKAYAGTHGLIRDHKTKQTEILSVCDCSLNKLKPGLKELQRMGWIHMDDYCIKLNSWRTIYEKCCISFFRKIDRKFYKPEKINNEKQTHYWIYLADISDNRKRQAYMFHQKIIQNPELRLWLYGYLSSRDLDLSKADTDPEYVTSVLSVEYIHQFSSGSGTEMYDWLTENRPDVNRGVNGMARAWDTKPMNVSYVKKKIVQQEIGYIQKTGTITSPGRSRNNYVHLTVVDGTEKAKGVGYNRATKSTFQAFCDDILPRQATTNADQQFKIQIAA